MTGLVLVGTISSGHMFWQQLRGWRVLPCVGLALLFVAGTFYCVVASAARNAEVGVSKALEIVSSNEQRHRLESEITLAQQDARKAKAAASKDCATGEGPVCRSLTKLATQADSHYWLLVGRLASSKPEQSANPGLQHAAHVLAVLPFVKADAREISRGLELFSPFLKALFLEIATVVFFGIGLGHANLTDLTVTDDKVDKIGKAQQALQEVLPPRKASVIIDRRPDSHDDVATILAVIGNLYRPITNTELAGLMGCSAAEASRRATVAESQGLIIRQRLGRHVAISLKPTVDRSD